MIIEGERMDFEITHREYKYALYVYLNPKVASTSMREVLETDTHWQWRTDNEYFIAIDRSAIAENLKHFRPFRFGFVRNPYERIFSAYKMFKFCPSWKNRFPWNEISKTNFDNFINSLYCGQTSFRPFLEGPPNGHVNLSPGIELSAQEWSGWRTTRPIVELDSHINRQSRHIPKSIDFIGKLERFSDDWHKLQKIIGIRFMKEATKKQPEPYGSAIAKLKKEQIPQKVMTQETANKIYEIYREDFDNFGYNRADYGGFVV
tara:strand:- start:20912 stop:21694 length:783 start_codon:yes stop_codon:yes gene_type:complete